MINIQNMNDNQCCKWCINSYLNPVDHHPPRIRKIDEILADELDFELRFYNSIDINVFGYKNKKKTSDLCITKML